MKKTLIASGLGLLINSAGAATPLESYEAIQAALLAGDSIHVVTDFAQCSAPAEQALRTMMVGIFSPNEIGFTERYMATAFTHFTMNDHYFPNKPVMEYVRYTLTQDNTMAVSLSILDPSNYQVLKDKLNFTCKLNTAVKVFS